MHCSIHSLQSGNPEINMSCWVCAFWASAITRLRWSSGNTGLSCIQWESVSLLLCLWIGLLEDGTNLLLQLTYCKPVLLVQGLLFLGRVISGESPFRWFKRYIRTGPFSSSARPPIVEGVAPPWHKPNLGIKGHVVKKWSDSGFCQVVNDLGGEAYMSTMHSHVSPCDVARLICVSVSGQNRPRPQLTINKAYLSRHILRSALA